MDAHLADDFSLGEWLHGELMDAYGYETEAWAVDRVERISKRLHAERGSAPPLQAEILWVGAMNAFAAPGRYVYITRELLQRADGDEPIALVLAHEIAHHDLQHVQLLRGWLSRLPHAPSSLLVAALCRQLEKQLIGPERELAADSYALDMCLAAGYDGARCLGLFDNLEAHLLDHGDLDGVFGTDAALARNQNDHGVNRWLEQARVWTDQHLRGYPPLRARKSALVARLRGYGVPVSPNLSGT